MMAIIIAKEDEHKNIQTRNNEGGKAYGSGNVKKISWYKFISSLRKICVNLFEWLI